jgi:hypothetical protein
MKQVKHWQDPVNAVLGAWLILSPWAAAYSGDAVATGNAVVVGVVLIAAALGAMLVPRAWEEWTEAALGMWLMASPWALGYAGLGDAMRVATATGVAIVVLALWTLASDKDYSAWLRGSKAQ